MSPGDGTRPESVPGMRALEYAIAPGHPPRILDPCRLPAAPAARMAVPPAPPVAPRGSDRILIVDDEAPIRSVPTRLRARLDYEPFAGADAAGASEGRDSAEARAGERVEAGRRTGRRRAVGAGTEGAPERGRGGRMASWAEATAFMPITVSFPLVR